MAQTGYTTIQLYASGVAGAVPLASNLTNNDSGLEIAINYADNKLFYKNGTGTVVGFSLAGAGSSANTQVLYNNAGVLTGSANFTYDGASVKANRFLDGFVSLTASGTQLVLTPSSAPNYLVTGSGSQAIQLPNATWWH